MTVSSVGCLGCLGTGVLSNCDDCVATFGDTLPSPELGWSLGRESEVPASPVPAASAARLRRRRRFLEADSASPLPSPVLATGG